MNFRFSGAPFDDTLARPKFKLNLFDYETSCEKVSLMWISLFDATLYDNGVP